VLTKSKTLTTLARVYPEVERLVQYVADKMGYSGTIVRNIAILLGLISIIGLKKLPKDDDEFFELYEKARRFITE